MSTLLETDGLTVTFGGLNANNHVNINVEKGTFVGLIGPNGAGKTTFIDAITGFVTPSAGTVHFDGGDITGLSRPRTGSQGPLPHVAVARAVRGPQRERQPPRRRRAAALVLVHHRHAPPDSLDRASTTESTGRSTTVGLSDVRDTLPSDLPHGAASSSASPAPSSPSRSSSSSTSRPPASTPPRARCSAATSAGCSTKASPCS